MTRGSEPSDPPVPDSLSSESERRRWIHKRAQFDSAINTARLLGVVQNLALGSMSAKDALRIILEVNASKDQAQYVAEMLAMKKEFRDLARIEFSDGVAQFILDGSRLVPNLTGGLASQMLMAMGHAAQNDAYLETVSRAVSTLLSDLDHPLMPDARNYLRLLWDQMEATRRLKQTEALYTGQRGSLTPAERSLRPERRSSGSLPVAKPVKSQLEVSPPPLDLGAPVAVPRAAHSPTKTMLGLGEVTPSEPPPAAFVPPTSDAQNDETPRIDVHPSNLIERESEATFVVPIASAIERQFASHPVAAPETRGAGESQSKLPVQPERSAERSSSSKFAVRTERVADRVSLPAVTTPSEPVAKRHSTPHRVEVPEPEVAAPPEPVELEPTAPSLGFEPSLSEHEQRFFDTGDEPSTEDSQPSLPLRASAPERAPAAPRAALDTVAETPRFDAPVESPKFGKPPLNPADFKVPTHGVPKLAVAAVVTLALAGAGLVVALTSESEKNSDAPAPSASEAKKPVGSAAPAVLASARKPRTTAKPSAAAPPPPPHSQPAAEPPTPTPPGINRAPKPDHVAPNHPVTPPHAEPTNSSPARTRPAVNTPAPAVTVPKLQLEPKAEPAQKPPAVVTPSEVARTLSPLDRITAELRLISPDPVGIEDKARELARIIARSKRKEAARIIEDLGPSYAVDPLGRDSTLEDSLQTFAVSVLGRVATDDDDNRAVDALLLLGEWVKQGGKGKQKALSILQTLSRDTIIKTSAPRLRALKTAQALAD